MLLHELFLHFFIVTAEHLLSQRQALELGIGGHAVLAVGAVTVALRAAQLLTVTAGHRSGTGCVAQAAAFFLRAHVGSLALARFRIGRARAAAVARSLIRIIATYR